MRKEQDMKMRSNGWTGLAATLVALLALSASAGAAELAYRWKKGATYRFQVDSQDTLAMTGMGVDVNARFATRSVFALAIERVRPDGSAEASLNIESFEVRDPEGRTLSALSGLPKGALKNPVDIDTKGRFRFKEVVYLLVPESGGSILVSGKAGATGVSATGQAGDEQVTVFAEFDPKTGKLRGGATVKTVGKKKDKKVKVRQDARKVDLVPRQFLEMLRLPDGDIQAGQSASVDLAGTQVSTEVVELTDKTARLKYTVRTEASAGDASSGMPGMPNGMPGMPAMPSVPGMGGVPGMDGDEGGDEAGGEDQAAAAMPGGAMPSLSVSGEFTLDIDVAQGMMSAISGTLKTRAGMGGMASMDAASTIDMKRLVTQ
jgi:hypothetical protein